MTNIDKALDKIKCSESKEWRYDILFDAVKRLYRSQRGTLEDPRLSKKHLSELFILVEQFDDKHR